MMQSDVFVLVDNVQFQKKEFQNRNRIRTKEGWMWLTVPVLVKRRFYQNINEVLINNNETWKKRHLRSILINYSKAPYFKELKDDIIEIYSKNYSNLIEINQTIINFVIDKLKIKTKTFLGSDIGIKGKKTDLIIDICKKTDCKTYLSGPTGRKYVDVKKFDEVNLNHLFQNFIHPTYKQQFKPFIPNMSILDILLNEGPEKSKEIIENSGNSSDV